MATVPRWHLLEDYIPEAYKVFTIRMKSIARVLTRKISYAICMIWGAVVPNKSIWTRLRQWESEPSTHLD